MPKNAYVPSLRVPWSLVPPSVTLLPEIYEAYHSSLSTSIRSFVTSELGLEVPLELELAVLVLELKSFSGFLGKILATYGVYEVINSFILSHNECTLLDLGLVLYFHSI